LKRLVIDASTLVSGITGSDRESPPCVIYDVVSEMSIEAIICPRLLAEVERALRAAALWDEAKDRLHESALALSGGQMQRLCIARSLVTRPEILLFDEPTSALDPTATAKIEKLIASLRDEVTVLIVTHNMQQAARCSDFTAYMYLGDLVEFGPTAEVFMKPAKKDTEDYITGRFG